MNTCEIATIQVMADSAERFLAGIAEGAEVIRRQPGCDRVWVMQCVEQSTTFLLFADWDCVESHDRFRKSDDFARYRATVEDCFAQPPTFQHYTMTSVQPA